MIYRTLKVSSLLVGCLLSAEAALAQTPGTYPFVGAYSGADCSATSSVGLSRTSQSACTSTATGATAQAQVTPYDLKASVAVQEGGQTAQDSSFGSYAAHTRITENVFIKPNDMQYAGSQGTISFLFDLDGYISGDAGNGVLFQMNQIVPFTGPFQGWNTTYGSGKWLGEIIAKDGSVVSNISSVFESRLTIGAPPVDVYVNGVVIFTFPIQFNSGTTFERNLSVYAGAASSFVDFFNTASFTGVQAFDANGNAVAIDLVNTQTGSSYTWATSPVPEPTSWALMLIGFAAIGRALRQRRPSAIAQPA